MLMLLFSALAADWPILQGTETQPDAPAIRAWGFAQVLAEGIAFDRPVEGLEAPGLAPYDGQRATFNRVGEGDARWGFSIRRARVGLRGVVPNTDQRVSWTFASEFGDNALTRLNPVLMTDLSMTFSYLPGARIRVGQFKLPLGEESLEANPIAAEFVNFSAPTLQLLLENPAEGGQFAAGASGFRDIGVQVFDTFSTRAGDLSYAVMLSNGGRMGTTEIDDGKDLTARVAWHPFVWGEPGAQRRDELGVYGFWQHGTRTHEGDDVLRIRRGGGVKFEKDGWRARAEVVQARGMIVSGPTFAGQEVGVAADGTAIGGHTYVHHRRGHAGGGLRYDALWRRTDSAPDLRVFHTVTADAQLILTPRARVLVDYELRWLAAPDGNADARKIAATLGDRVSVQGVVVF